MNKETKAFIRGAACVIATIHRDHGHSTETREAFKACIGTYENLIKAGCDEFDLEMLQMFNISKSEIISSLNSK